MRHSPDELATLLRYVEDASGHEHKGKGPGGGQFTGTGEGQSPDAMAKTLPQKQPQQQPAAGRDAKIAMLRKASLLGNPSGYQAEMAKIHAGLEAEAAKAPPDAVAKLTAAIAANTNPFKRLTIPEAAAKAGIPLEQAKGLLLRMDKAKQIRLGPFTQAIATASDQDLDAMVPTHAGFGLYISKE